MTSAQVIAKEWIFKCGWIKFNKSLTITSPLSIVVLAQILCNFLDNFHCQFSGSKFREIEEQWTSLSKLDQEQQLRHAKGILGHKLTDDMITECGFKQAMVDEWKGYITSQS